MANPVLDRGSQRATFVHELGVDKDLGRENLLARGVQACQRVDVFSLIVVQIYS